MLSIHVGADDLLHTRFALSPSFELCGLLRVLSRPFPHTVPPAWITRMRPVYRRLCRNTDLPAVVALIGPKHGADFIAPPPRSLSQTWSDEMAAVRATPPEQVQSEIDRCLALQPVREPRAEAVLRHDDVLERIAGALDTAWHALLASEWLRLRAICERDVLHRLTQLGRQGWAAALGGLHRTVRWGERSIEIGPSDEQRTIDLGGNGMLFVPSVFVWPGVAVHLDSPGLPAVIYPARGTGALWSRRTSPVADEDALAALVGRSRARILLALAEPTTTTHLAHLLDLAVGAVGDGLAILRRSGMVDRVRRGRAVVYTRTPLGDAVVAGDVATGE